MLRRCERFNFVLGGWPRVRGLVRTAQLIAQLEQPNKIGSPVGALYESEFGGAYQAASCQLEKGIGRNLRAEQVRLDISFASTLPLRGGDEVERSANAFERKEF